MEISRPVYLRFGKVFFGENWEKWEKMFFPLDTSNEFIEKKMRKSIFAMLLTGETEVYGRDMKLERR